MGSIQVLDNHTIDQIAAGEVVERPSSVVKELIENAMDAGATAITVEIKNGGIEYIRVTDNGSGIAKEDMKVAFLRHATSKLHDIDDLSILKSMGFRGEALASISAVSKMECISKTKEALLGFRYSIAGGVGEELEEVGAPVGTTMVVRNLFYNTPVRRKFLKSESTEGSHIEDMLQHLAMARPDISFQFINAGKTKLSTTGSSDLGEIVYRIFGRETKREAFAFQGEGEDVQISGILGTPVLNKSSRSYENFFVNERYVKSDILSKAVEEGYHGYVMQHKYPFCVLHIFIDPAEVDVNVHPAKTEIRLKNTERIREIVSRLVQESLHKREMIPECPLDKPATEIEPPQKLPEVFESSRMKALNEAYNPVPIMNIPKPDLAGNVTEDKAIKEKDIFEIDFDAPIVKETQPRVEQKSEPAIERQVFPGFEQLSFIPEEEKVLSKEARKKYEIIGQIFNTYWIITYHDAVYFVDQHAAHEKVNYEKLIKKYNENKIDSQILSPPIILSVSPSEKMVLIDNRIAFENLGFSFDEFGGSEIALRAVPMEVYFSNEKEMFQEILAELCDLPGKKDIHFVTSQIATMACKASVKGGKKMSREEIESLIDALLECENPYHCPHGRPTIFSMKKTELEKKFKRIVE